jgi:CheY-like chemotaxis protein
LEILKNTKINMVLLDLHMPDMDGYQTAQGIRQFKSYESIPIVALTADATSNIMEKVKLSGMDGCISKPIRLETLNHTLKKYFQCESIPEGGKLFDYQRCMDNLNGNRVILNDLVNRFISEHSTKCYMVRKYVSIGNYLNARKILHDIVGLSGNLCCDALHDVSTKLLQELHNETFESLEEFTSIWKNTIQALREYTSTNSAKGRDVDISSKLSKLTSLCQSYDISAIEYFADNREYFSRVFNSTEVKEIERHLKRYDFQWTLKQLIINR